MSIFTSEENQKFLIKDCFGQTPSTTTATGKEGLVRDPTRDTSSRPFTHRDGTHRTLCHGPEGLGSTDEIGNGESLTGDLGRRRLSSSSYPPRLLVSIPVNRVRSSVLVGLVLRKPRPVWTLCVLFRVHSSVPSVLDGHGGVSPRVIR